MHVNEIAQQLSMPVEKISYVSLSTHACLSACNIYRTVSFFLYPPKLFRHLAEHQSNFLKKMARFTQRLMIIISSPLAMVDFLLMRSEAGQEHSPKF